MNILRSPGLAAESGDPIHSAIKEFHLKEAGHDIDIDIDLASIGLLNCFVQFHRRALVSQADLEVKTVNIGRSMGLGQQGDVVPSNIRLRSYGRRG